MPLRLLALAATILAGGMLGSIAGHAATADMIAFDERYALPAAGDEQEALAGLAEEQAASAAWAIPQPGLGAASPEGSQGGYGPLPVHLDDGPAPTGCGNLSEC